ncbi:hypothetical protein AB0N73_06120 [Microbacterium sp. NPDC089189]|uniref:hypothetical protein n=1 Tax=Microbacterium sp. NPDC089189 TaxID=3154972 RepID=UPI00343073CA
MDFWQFVGSYWWLVFPVGGAAAAAIKGISATWERNARERHQRRLEILQVKKGLVPAAPVTEAIPAARPASPSTALPQTLAAHDAVTARWLEYELDVAKMIAYPAMSDGRQPLTAAFLRAKKVADRMRPASADGPVDAEQLRAYQDAVTDYEVAFEVAERDARRLKDSSFSPAERKRLDVAQQLLSVAVDEAATPAERQLAYKRVREELDGLISLSDEAVDALEKKVALELPSTRDDRTL